MKTIPETLAIIDIKIKEHKTIIQQLDSDIDSSRKLQVDASRTLEQAMKTMVLKDKVIFHKAALLTLEDLRISINV